MKFNSRRKFLKEFGLGALGVTTATSISQLKAINAAFLNNSTSFLANDYKAIVWRISVNQIYPSKIGSMDSLNSLTSSFDLTKFNNDVNATAFQ